MFTSSPLKNTDIAIVFGKNPEGFGIRSLKCDDSSKEFIAPNGPQLWQLELIDESGKITTLRSDCAPDDCQQTESSLIMCWHSAAAVVTVTAELRENAVELRLAVSQIPPQFALRRVLFPHFDWQLEPTKDCKFISSIDGGAIFENPLTTLPSGGIYEQKHLRERAWPNGMLTLQLLGLNLGQELCGFYAFDKEAIVKSFNYGCDRQGQRLTVRPYWRVPRAYGRDYSSFGWRLMLQRQGDWFDLARYYRPFAVAAPWCSQGPLEAGKKTPEWLLKTPMLLLRDNRGPGWSAEDFARCAEYFQVPLLLHYYMWHKCAFDTEYPFFFPEVPDFRAELKKLQQAGIRVMPYVNFYSADTTIPEWESLKSSAIQIDEDGNIHQALWSQQRFLAAMCPQAPMLRRIAKMVAGRLLDIGVDGLYLDEISMSPSYACCSSGHGHPAGDPTAFTHGFASLMDEIKSEALQTNGVQTILACESVNEPFVNQIDTAVVGGGNLDNAVPLYSAVYHDYAMGFGRYSFLCELDDPKYAGAIETKYAQQFIFGWQFGWSGIPISRLIDCAPETAAFLRRMARAKFDHWKYLACGKMLRPLKLDVPELKLLWALNEETAAERLLPAVLNSVWITDDTTIAVVLVNISSTSRQLQIALTEGEDYPIVGCTRGTASLYAGDTCQTVYPAGSAGEGMQVDLPARSVMVIRLPNVKDYGVHNK